jgi:hypothetical protein
MSPWRVNDLEEQMCTCCQKADQLQIITDPSNELTLYALQVIGRVERYDSTLFDKLDNVFLMDGVDEDILHRKSRLMTDGYYRHNYKGRSSISLNLKAILKEDIYEVSIERKLALMVPFLLAFLLFVPPMAVFSYCMLLSMKYRNPRFYLLFRYGHIPRRIRRREKDRRQLHILNTFLFYLGIHRSYEKYVINDDQMNLNLYESAYKFKLFYLDEILSNQGDITRR